MLEPSDLKATPGVAIIERESLVMRLRDNTEVPVVLVCAAAGFGKTTLAAQWEQHDPRTHQTVQLARFLDNPAALALRLIDALEAIGPGAGAIRDVVTAMEPSFSAILLPAITGLTASRDRDFVLVIDDVQLLTRPQCQALLRAVADGVPRGSQVAFLTRPEPPLWLARTRAEGRLCELGTSDLAFDAQESHRLLEILEVGVHGEAATDLIQRAEGWPVGLYLMALALQPHLHRNGPRAEIGALASDQFIVDYLRAEVLAVLPRRTTDFLRRTALLHELNSSLCDAVLGRRDSAAMLSTLSRQLQLVMRIGPDGLTYRYHNLLAEALRAELEAHEPWILPELQLRASTWYEAHGDRDAAIRYAKGAGDLDRTAALVWAGVPGCISSGRPDRLGTWLADLDEAQLRSNRWLTLAAAWLELQTGDQDRMTRWILAAEAHAGPDWTTRISTDEFAASLACVHILIGDHGLEGSIGLCRGARLGLPRDSGFRAATFVNEGIALTLTGQTAQGQECLEQAELLGRALNVPIVEANALAWQGLLALLSDDWARGAPLIVRAGQLIKAHRLERLATAANCTTATAFLQASRGDKNEARVTLGTARRLTIMVSPITPWFAVGGRVVQARTAILLGDGALARTLCSDARDRLIPDLEGTMLSAYLADTESRLRLLLDEQVSASAITAAELRVLQFLPSRLTFRQIGEHLFLSQTTIKTHSLSIYRKLGVSSRDDAVARAQSLGLVEAPPLA
ncbi:MAG: LuxR C-terminal-related transcriptional regulator [Propionicimonas sp.]